MTGNKWKERAILNGAALTGKDRKLTALATGVGVS